MGNALSCLAPGSRQLLTHALHGNASAVRTLLENKPEMADVTFFGSSRNLVHHAAGRGHLDVLKSAVETLHSVAQSSEYGGGVREFKDSKVVTITWERFLKDVLNASTSSGETPLMLACQQGHVECAVYLLEHGADVFAIDKHLRRNCLHYAASSNRANVLRRLLDENTQVQTEEGLQSLRHLRVHDVSGQCRFIDARAENGMTALHLAAAFAGLDTLQVLLAAGASMMVRTVDLDLQPSQILTAGSTPLHLAARRGHVGLIQAMLQAHADAMGTWGGVRGQRRVWEGDGRMDLRSVANVARQLPFHDAWNRGHRQAANLLNPSLAIDAALESSHELAQGYGPQALAVLAAYAMRMGLLQWLEQYKVDRAQQVAALSGKNVVRKQRQRGQELCFDETADQAVQQVMQTRAATGEGTQAAAAVQEGAQEASQEPPAQPEGAASVESSSSHLSMGFLGALNQQRRAMRQAPGLRSPHAPTAQEPAAAARPAAGPSFNSPFAALASDLQSAGERASSGQSPPPAGPNQGRGQNPDGQAQAAVESAPQEGGPNAPHASGGIATGSQRGSFTQPHTMGPYVSRISTGGELPPLHITPHASRGTERSQRSQPSLPALLALVPSGYLRRTLSSIRRPSHSGRLESATKETRSSASVPGFAESSTFSQEDQECGICLDDPVEVGVGPCRHRLCLSCAVKLCEIHKKPPLCPFCRCTIAGFIPEPVRPSASPATLP